MGDNERYSGRVQQTGDVLALIRIIFHGVNLFKIDYIGLTMKMYKKNFDGLLRGL